MITIGRMLQRHAPDGKIALIHDHTKHNGEIREAFDAMNAETRWVSRKFFTTIAPMKWQDCIQLQAADLIAYETFKLVDSRLYTNREMRRFLKEMIGNKVQMSIKFYDRATIEELRRIHENAEVTPLTTQVEKADF